MVRSKSSRTVRACALFALVFLLSACAASPPGAAPAPGVPRNSSTPTQQAASLLTVPAPAATATRSSTTGSAGAGGQRVALTFLTPTPEPTATAIPSPTPTLTPAEATPTEPGSTLPAGPTLPTFSASPHATNTPAGPPPTSEPRSTPAPGVEPRIFIASEATNSVQVWQGEPPRFLRSVPVGIFPHNISASNNGRWIATANRHSGDISIVDAAGLVEVARIKVGRAPHDLSWSPDDKLLYVTQELEYFVTVIDTVTWRALDPILVDSPQHDLAISPDGTQIWLTTIRYRGLLVVDRISRQVIDRLAYFPHGSHDITFRPEANEVWVTSSGFIENTSQADPFVVVFDYSTHKIKSLQPVGIYPFHSVKRFRDGLYLPTANHTLWYSDRGLGGVILVDVPTREVIGQVPTGRGPFHLSFGPNGLLYVANHDDSTFSVIDPEKRVVLHTISVAPDPHGIVVLAVPLATVKEGYESR